MRSAFHSILLIALLTGCASAGKPPACSGPRRPANPYGSVLSSGAPKPAMPTDGAAAPCAGVTP